MREKSNTESFYLKITKIKNSLHMSVFYSVNRFKENISELEQWKEMVIYPSRCTERQKCGKYRRLSEKI